VPIPAATPALTLDLLPTPLAIVRLAPPATVPEWTTAAKAFLSITRTPDELSIVADAAAVPGDITVETRWLALRVRGPLPLDLVGVMAAIATQLAAAGMPIFPIATHDTDYVLVREHDAGAAIRALTSAGHLVVR
jgi:uncharacterized protein